MKQFLIALSFFISTSLYAYPKIQVDTLIDFTSEDSAALKIELKIFQLILNHDTFWETIKSTEFYCSDWRRLHYYRKRKAQYPRLKKDRHEYTSKEIHDLLWNGDDEIGSKNDSIINLKLKAKDYEQVDGKTRHGGTDKNTLIISTNRKTRIHSKKRGEYACHLLHEYMHILGFKHRKNLPSKTTKKCEGVDVALSIQYIGRDVVKDLFSE